MEAYELQSYKPVLGWDVCLDRAQDICKARLSSALISSGQRAALMDGCAGEASTRRLMLLPVRVGEQGKAEPPRVQKAEGEAHQPGHSNPSQGACGCRQRLA